MREKNTTCETGKMKKNKTCIIIRNERQTDR